MKQAHPKTSVKPFWQILCILVLLSLLVFMLFTELSRAKGTYLQERAVLTSYTLTDTLSGYVFRNETALRSNNNGPVSYRVNEGDAVSGGTVVAEVYIDDTATDKREQAALLQAQIDLYQAALADGDTPWQSNYAASYRDLMHALQGNALPTAATQAGALAAALSVRDAAVPQTAAALQQEINLLQAQLDRLVEYVDQPQIIPAENDGYFYRTTDGYEALFGTAAAVGLTPEGLSELLAAPTSTEDCIGKLVRDGAWYLALPVEAALAATYVTGESYTVHIGTQAEPVMLLLEQINSDADGGSALLLMRGEVFPVGMDVCRRQCVRIEKQTVEGLALPAAAIRADHTVFVNENGVARLRAIAPIEGCPCSLVQVNTADGYLKEGERILISTRSLYDGKVLE